MSRSHNLDLPYIMPAQAQKHVTHNDALSRLDHIVQASVIERNIDTPPADPQDGARYITGDTPSGDWSGYARTLMARLDGAWVPLSPKAGWRCWVEAESQLVVFDEGAWMPIAGGSANTDTLVAMLGVNTQADANNRLSVKSPAVLFSHEDGSTDMRLISNKHNADATAALLFQTNYSGRAEMGLMGDDNFKIKTSMDGTDWAVALEIDSGSGSVSFPQTDLSSNRPNDVLLTLEDRYTPAVRITGHSRDNTADDNDGVGLYLTHNSTGNRQFTLMSTDTQTGFRVVAAGTIPIVDGYRNGARADLQIGTNSHGAHIGYALSATQFSVNNWGGDTDKTVFEIGGATAQSGDYLAISSSPSARSDMFRIDKDGAVHLSAPVQLSSAPKASLPSPAIAGGLIFVPDAAGGSCPAYSDGTNWRRVSDQTIVN